MKKENSNWKKLLAESVVSADELARRFPVRSGEVRQVIARYPMRINPYYLSLLRGPGDPLWKQVVPDIAEIEDLEWEEDPLREEMHSPVPGLICRYPDRAVLLVSSRCAVYCRYCMRKRRVGGAFSIGPRTIAKGVDHIRRNTGIRDVILSGGDPLLLDDRRLCSILDDLVSIPHVEILRIHTRVPCALPQRVTRALCRRLKAYHPLYVNVHINHPDEITADTAQACSRLSDAGIPLGGQTVLLKGVNDEPAVMRTLMQKLLKIRVKPYYLHHPDLVRGTRHFQTSVGVGLNIVQALQGHTSGLCVPHYMVDLPGGGGKIPLVSQYVKEKKPGKWLIENHAGKTYEYPVTGP